MNSLIRPTKRQKQDNVSEEVFMKPEVSNINKCRDSTKLLPLVERLADTPLVRSEGVTEIIGQIRSHRYFLERDDLRQNETLDLNNDHDKNLSIRKLHGTLILYLGFLLGSYKQKSISNEKWEEVLCSLVVCLRDLYTSNNGNLLKYSVEEEFNELFILLSKILLNTSSEGFRKVDVFHVKIRAKISMSCYQIIKSWLDAPILLKKVLTESTTTMLENFIFGLLKSRDINTIRGTNEEDHSLEILERLRSLCDDKSEFRKLLDVTLLVMQSHPSSSCGHLSPQLNIFYWRCVSCVIFEEGTKTGKNTEIEIADRAVDSMMPYSTSNNRLLSGQAMSCICEFIQNSSYDSHIRLIHFATKIVAETNPRCGERTIGNVKDNGIDENLIQTLRCFGLCIKKAYATEYFLQMNDWGKTFDNLARLTVDKKDMNVAEKAAIVLIPISKALITADGHRSSMFFRKAMNVLLKLISLHHAWIVGTTLELLFTLLQNLEIRRHIVSSALSTDLVNVLAPLASQNSLVEESKKAKLAQTFSTLIDEIRNIHFLVRKSSNLAFLVILANGSYCETDQSRAQQIAICTIMKLARNPCNRRILAKEPGLLSSLIRYIRMAPEDSDFLNKRSVSRKEIKDRIVLMANAL